MTHETRAYLNAWARSHESENDRLARQLRELLARKAARKAARRAR